jgi:glucose/arabinose dehydrogenase
MHLRSARFALFAFVVLLIGCSDKDSGPTGPPPGFSGDLDLELVAGGLDDPLFVTSPPGDSRVFIVERSGAIRIFKNGALLPDPFVTVTGLALGNSEQGLLGLAFDPLYATNGRFYVALTAAIGAQGEQQIRRYQVSANPDVADPAGQVILNWADTAPNHNGGMLEFGPDGMLYASVGDGGEQGDPNNRAQRTDDGYFGSILRLDVRSGAVASPGDNPYPSAPYVYSIGLRNPWRFSFDLLTGDLYIGDVGFQTREEIDVSPAPNRGKGANYGWKVIEGTDCYSPGTGCTTTGFTPPVVDYPRSDGCCVIGGFVYRGTQIDGLQGTYFYADHCQRWVRSFYYSGGVISQQKSWGGLSAGDNVTSFGQDAAGELYICTEGNGNVYKIVGVPTVASR